LVRRKGCPLTEGRTQKRIGGKRGGKGRESRIGGEIEIKNNRDRAKEITAALKY